MRERQIGHRSAMRRIGIVCSLLWLTIAGGTIATATDTGRIAGTQAQDILLQGAAKRFRIEFREAGVKEAFRFLAEIAGTNLVIPENVEGTITVALDDITVVDAINALTKANGLDYAIERGILRVGKREDFTASGEDLKTQTFRLKYAVAAAMAKQVKELLTTRGSVLADARTNSLVIRETVANLEQIGRFVENVDIRDAQVLIEAKLIEATRDWARDVGIQWGANMSGNKANVLGVASVGTADSGRVLQVDLPATNPTSGLGLLVGTLGGGTNIDLQITAAEQRGDLHVISEPSIVTSNGVAAHIRSGETIYVKTAGSVQIGGSSASGGDSGLEQIETGVELNVTPHISVDEYIKMEIETITSAPDFTRTVDGIPAILDNKATTTVLVHDNDMTVIGGLLRFRGQDTRRKVPFLGDVPLLGYLFQSRSRSKTNNDMMIFIRPTIVRERVMSPLQNELPHLHNVKQDMSLDDDDHLPTRTKSDQRTSRERRFRSRYEQYREQHAR
ncbi:MAG: hypothetical protein HYV02_03685 [Deltaproteobacteria bacterium]|nr:hypothetical protein [Deltaproteobacteria bacterium]